MEWVQITINKSIYCSYILSFDFRFNVNTSWWTPWRDGSSVRVVLFFLLNNFINSTMYYSCTMDRIMGLEPRIMIAWKFHSPSPTPFRASLFLLSFWKVIIVQGRTCMHILCDTESVSVLVSKCKWQTFSHCVCSWWNALSPKSDGSKPLCPLEGHSGVRIHCPAVSWWSPAHSFICYKLFWESEKVKSYLFSLCRGIFNFLYFLEIIQVF